MATQMNDGVPLSPNSNPFYMAEGQQQYMQADMTQDHFSHGGVDDGKHDFYHQAAPMSQTSLPHGGSAYHEAAAAGVRQREPYPAWTVDKQIPLSKEEIEDIFIDLANKFGFQRDNMRNMYDHLMILLDSRASRMSPQQALLTLHADYIGGEHANYRKWYFAAQLDLDDAIGKVQILALRGLLVWPSALVRPSAHPQCLDPSLWRMLAHGGVMPCSA